MWERVRGSWKEPVSPAASVVGPGSAAGVAGGCLLPCCGAGSGAVGAAEPGWGAGDVRGEQRGPGAGCCWGARWAARLDGAAPQRCFALRCSERGKDGCGGFLEEWGGRNGRANSELAEQTGTKVKQSGPVLVKLSKYCIKPAAGSGACPSHQV